MIERTLIWFFVDKFDSFGHCICDFYPLYPKWLKGVPAALSSSDSQREEEDICKHSENAFPGDSDAGLFPQMRATGLMGFLEAFCICVFKKEGLDPSRYEVY